MERLLVHTIYVRTRSRLTDIKQELQGILKDVDCKFLYFLKGKLKLTVYVR